MKILVKSRPVPLPPPEVLKAFDRRLFLALRPPLLPMKLVRFDGCHLDGITEVLLGFPPLRMRWVSRNTEEYARTDEVGFTDEGTVLPFFLRAWKHHHRIRRLNDHHSLIADEIELEFRNPFYALIFFPALRMSFAYRRKAYARYFSKIIKNRGDR